MYDNNSKNRVHHKHQLTIFVERNPMFPLTCMHGTSDDIINSQFKFTTIHIIQLHFNESHG